MADDLQSGAADPNVFDQVYAQGEAAANNPQAAPPSTPSDNPFDAIGPDIAPASSASGSFLRSAEKGALPAAGGLVGAGAGAEAGGIGGAAHGGAIGSIFTVVGKGAGAGIGGVVGGVGGSIAGFMGAATAIQHAQDWALSKLPESWQEKLGVDQKQQELDEKLHPVASFLGGLAPYAVTMSPGGFAKAALPANATTFQRIIANPLTARLFGGTAMGGMELGQEKAEGGDIDWRKVAIATGFGLVFNKPTAIGERLTGFGARFVNPLAADIHDTAAQAHAEINDIPPPTVAQAADSKVMGTGITEQVYHGQEEQSPQSAMTAQEAARTEMAVMGTEPDAEPDLHAMARRIDPDTFEQYDALAAQRETFRSWISDFNSPPDEDLAAAQSRQAELQAQLDQHIEAANGYTGGPEARRLRAQIRDQQGQYDTLVTRREAYAAGQGVDTPEVAAIRQKLLDADFAMRDLAPAVSAAYRRAAEFAGQGIEPPPLEQKPVPPEPEAAAGPIPGEVAPPAVSPRPIEEQLASIANDVAQKLIQAGRPADEAEASGRLIAARYQARADRFGGKLGTPEALYLAEGPEIKGARPQVSPVAEPAVTPDVVGSAQDETAKELAQGRVARGRIRIVDDQRPVITLMKDANASTFIHETGHQWLEELMRDNAHEQVPTDLKADAQTVRDWLKVEGDNAIKTGQHEKFARGFEQYMREGVAPSPALASVFSKFRDWLVTLYQTLRGLGKPINEDVRGVFDRLLANEPQRTVIAPDREASPAVGELHKLEAAEVEPAEADAVSRRIDAEKQRYITEQQPEILGELAAKLGAPGSDGTSEPSEGAGGSSEVVAGSGGPDALAPGGGRGEEHGNVVGSPGAGGAEGSELRGGDTGGGSDAGNGGQRPVSGKNAGPGFAPEPATLLGAAESPYLDKAGNIRLDNLTTKQDVAKAIIDAAEDNDDFIGDRRGVVTDGQVAELADALGMDYASLSRRKVGQAFNAEQIMAARKLLIQSATEVSAAMKRAAEGTDQDVMAYAQAKDRHQMIQGQVAGITAEAGRALRAFRDISTEAGTQAANVNEFLKGATGKTLYQLRMEAKMGAGLDTPQKISKFMVDARKASFGRMLLEYWINGLISGPATHTTYAIGNTLLALEKAGPETATAAAIGALRQSFGRPGETVRLGEVGAQIASLRKLGPAIKAAVDAMRTGVTTLLPGEDLRTLPPGARKALEAFAAGQKPASMPFQPGSELVQPAMLDEAARYSDTVGSAFGLVRGIRDGILSGGALLSAGGVKGSPLVGLRRSPMGYIPDVELRGVNLLPVGTAARLPGRFIASIHSFFRSVNYSMEKAAISYRTAANEGLMGQAFDSRVGDLRQNPTPEMMESARGEATNLTLMGQGGEFVRKLGQLTNATFNLPVLGETQLLKFVDPFVHIAANVMDQSLVQRSPLGLLSPELRADLAGKNGNIAQDKATARMLVGTAMSIGFGSLAAEGYISGSGPSDPQHAAIDRLAGNQPHSVRIGDIWYDVHRLGPLGMLLGISADMYDVAHTAAHGDLLNAASMLQHALTQNVLDESFMKGPADLIQAIEDPGRYGQAYIRNFLSSFVPYSVGMSQMARASDPYSRQARSVMDAIKAKVPGISETLFPRRDIWGMPMPNRDTLIAPGVTAIYEQQISHDPVNLAMSQLGMGVSQPERKIRNVALNDQQYDDYSRISGVTAKLRLNQIVRSADWPRWPDDARRNIVTEVIKQSREMARNMVMMKYPTIPAQAQMAKINRFKN